MARADIVIGKWDDEGDLRALRLPAEVITQTIAILARKEGGKTYAGMLLAEGMLDIGGQVIVIDGPGKWWALRVGADGRSRGKDIFVLGGKHGDAPLHADAGKIVAKAVVEKNLSVVLDLTHLRKGQRIRFLADFGEEFLFQRQQQDAPVPAHVFVEEAQTVLPQMTGRSGRGPDELRMLGAFEDIARIGRNAGIGITMISQRPQSVNKEALSQTELLIALGVNEVAGRKVIDGWVQEKGAEHRELVGDLPGLSTGEAFVWSPSWLRFFGRVKIGKKATFDSSATARLGRRKAVGKLPKADTHALVEAIGEAGMAKLTSEDPAALRRRIAELERQVTGLTKSREETFLQAQKVENNLREKRVVKVPTPVIKPRMLQRLLKTLKAYDAAGERAERLADAIERIWLRAEGKAKVLDQPRDPGFDSRGLLTLGIGPKTKPTSAAAPAPKLAPTSKPAPTNTTISGYAKGLLETLAQRHPMSMTRSQLAVLSGRSVGSSAFSGAVAELVRLGLIWAKPRITITALGLELVGTVPPPKSGAELREHWLRALPAYEASLLRALIDAYPEGRVKGDLAGAAGKSVTSSAFSGACSTLLKNELVEAPGTGILRVVDALME